MISRQNLKQYMCTICYMGSMNYQYVKKREAMNDLKWFGIVPIKCTLEL